MASREDENPPPPAPSPSRTGGSLIEALLLPVLLFAGILLILVFPSGLAAQYRIAIIGLFLLTALLLVWTAYGVTIRAYLQQAFGRASKLDLVLRILLGLATLILVIAVFVLVVSPEILSGLPSFTEANGIWYFGVLLLFANLVVFAILVLKGHLPKTESDAWWTDIRQVNVLGVITGSILFAGWFLPRILNIRWCWGIAMVLIIFLLAAVGCFVHRRFSGVLINEYNCMSLSRLQVVLWSVLILAAITVVLLARVPVGTGDQESLALAINPMANCTAEEITGVNGADEAAGADEANGGDEAVSADDAAGADKAASTNKTAMADGANEVAGAEETEGADEATGLPNPFCVQIDWRLLALMGISVTTAVGAVLGNIKKTERKPSPKAKRNFVAKLNLRRKLKNNEDTDFDKELERLTPAGPAISDDVRNKIEHEIRLKADAQGDNTKYKNKIPEEARFSDIFHGDEIGDFDTLNITKVQNFFFTVVAVAIYAALLYTALPEYDAPVFIFPGIPEVLLAIIAISHAGYLGDKFLPHTNENK